MASYENLDPQDREICQAIENGVSDEEIKSQFGVGDEKIAQLRPVVEEAAKEGSAPAGDTGNDSGSENGGGE